METNSFSKIHGKDRLKLIELVRANNCYLPYMSSLISERVKRDLIWQKIANEINWPKDKVKDEWAKIRKNYNRHLKRRMEKKLKIQYPEFEFLKDVYPNFCEFSEQSETSSSMNQPEENSAGMDFQQSSSTSSSMNQPEENSAVMVVQQSVFLTTTIEIVLDYFDYINQTSTTRNTCNHDENESIGVSSSPLEF
ncbi:hypothetical protein DERP_014937, partial [Dermatophagoides pteronyssinus]